MQYKQAKTILQKIAQHRQASAALKIAVAKMLRAPLPRIGPHPPGGLRVLHQVASSEKTSPKRRLEALELLLEDSRTQHDQASGNVVSSREAAQIGAEESLLQALFAASERWGDAHFRFGLESLRKEHKLKQADFDSLVRFYQDLIFTPAKVSADAAKLLGLSREHPAIDRLIARHHEASSPWLRERIVEALRRLEQGAHVLASDRAKIQEFLNRTPQCMPHRPTLSSAN